jgi:hypothetical protein
MKATNLLKRFETLLSRYEFAQMKLDNGAVIEADEFAEGNAVFIVTEDDRVPLPIGEYELEDGRMIVVAEEGVLASIGDKVEEVEETAMEEEKKEEVVEMNYASKEELAEAVAEMKEMIEEVKAMVSGEEKEESMEEVKEEMSSEVEESVEAKEEELELSAELAKPSAEPIKHNPDAQTEVNLKKIGALRNAMTPMDRILERISNIKN